jgi:hypothetical protein
VALKVPVEEILILVWMLLPRLSWAAEVFHEVEDLLDEAVVYSVVPPETNVLMQGS